IPKAITREYDGRAYALSSDLRFVGPGDHHGRAEGEFLLEGLRPTINAFGVGSRRLRWRHTAETPAGVPVGSHVGWLVMETPPEGREVAVRFSASYRLRPEDAMGLLPGSRPVDRTVPLPAPAGGPRARPDADRARRVFLIHGRDDIFTGRIREVLSLLGLRVMEWDPLVYSAGSGPSPVLLDVIHHGLSRAQGIVALLTPDDVVSLHPELRKAREDAHEILPSMQPRPNVLMELGAALFAFRERTVLVKVGGIRPMADIGGVNYVAFDGPDAVNQLPSRLRAAGCEVDDSGSEWRRASRFEGLGAFERRPPVTGPEERP
ncbi:TIR domain-containing protein, partial [Streptomyces sp. NPDC052644]